MTWLTAVQAIAAIYFFGLLCMQTENLRSGLLFKLLPAILGTSLAFGAFAQWRGWPL